MVGGAVASIHKGCDYRHKCPMPNFPIPNRPMSNFPMLNFPMPNRPMITLAFLSCKWEVQMHNRRLRLADGSG